MKRNAILWVAVCLFAVTFARAAAAQKEPVDAPIPNPDANIAGNYQASVYMTMAAHQYGSNDAQTEKIVKGPWAFKQDGKKITGTAKIDKGDLPFSGTIEGNSFHGVVNDGDQHYTLHLTVDSDDGSIHGTIRMGIHEYLLTMAKAK